MSNSQPQVSRRRFVLSTTVAGTAVASATLLKTDAPVTVAEVLKAAPDKGGGYSLSDHVKQYYRTTRV